jgi:hypothetical protein
MIHDSDDPRLPDALVEELSRAYRAEVRVGPEVDRVITSGARAHLMRRGRLRLWIATAGTAAAALIVLAVLLLPRTTNPPIATAAEDVNHDGVVDIRDALLLQQQLNGGVSKGPDINHDGRVDRADVDAIAQRAVRLGGGAAR